MAKRKRNPWPYGHRWLGSPTRDVQVDTLSPNNKRQILIYSLPWSVRKWLEIWYWNRYRFRYIPTVIGIEVGLFSPSLNPRSPDLCGVHVFGFMKYVWSVSNIQTRFGRGIVHYIISPRRNNKANEKPNPSGTYLFGARFKVDYTHRISLATYDSTKPILLPRFDS